MIQTRIPRRFISQIIMSSSERKSELEANLSQVKATLSTAVSSSAECRLVAVSKTKPASDILALYESGHRHFGENAQELVDKANVLPKDIKWHFIGSFQSNKCNMLVKIPNLFVVETVDSMKKATQLNKACQHRDDKLNIFIQINTSGEEAKNGMTPDSCVEEAVAIVKECDRLILRGVMTIGSVEHSRQEDDNPDFLTLLTCRDRVLEAVKPLGIMELEVSMGMSDDFELAARMGSTNVRVGSLIFGARNYKK